jgi:predicted nucleotidyltransferase component of viral defense system
MIPKADLLARAHAESVLPTTVEKDYALGWLLCGVSQHPVLQKWVFKGGTCLKKCFFETYRFSEDLDFTVPSIEPLDERLIATSLREICGWVTHESGIEFPSEGFKTEEYSNKQGRPSFTAKLPFVGPLRQSRGSRQRVKFDITQDELLVDVPSSRGIFHNYADAPKPTPQLKCYSINELLAEKTRALYEREGRARDVYDVVHISRVFRDEIKPSEALRIVASKFAYKKLEPPTVDRVLARIGSETLRENWDHQLAHQLPVLPPCEDFESELRDALLWWMEPTSAKQLLEAVQLKAGEELVPIERFPGFGVAPGLAGTPELHAIRLAARNRLSVAFHYDGVPRSVEPYSLRRPATGKLLLYAYEQTRGGQSTGQIKAYKVGRIAGAEVEARSFKPRWRVEI